MKHITKTSIAVIIAAAMLLTLFGCDNTNIEGNNGDNNGNYRGAPHNRDSGLFDNGDTEEEYRVSAASRLVIYGVEDGDFMEAVVEEVDTAREVRRAGRGGRVRRRGHTVTVTDEEYRLYEDSEAAEIQKFHFPTVEIDGFELHRIDITVEEFLFLYAPTNPCDEPLSLDGQYVACCCWVYITIDRLCNFGLSPTEIFNELIERTHQHEQGIRHLTDDNMIYSEVFGDLTALSGDMLITIRVPWGSELNNYEFLRNLAFEIIETSELVVVDS